MINVKTLLIVGAGASVPYGYPTGKELRDELCDPNKLRNLSHKTHEAGIAEFCRVFRAAQKSSIDTFLAQRGDDYIGKSSLTFGAFGKLAIARRLIECENLKSLLWPDEDHWLEYLWNLMSADDLPKSEFANNQLKIISFNYDRVIEHYLQTVLENHYGVGYAEAAELRKSIDIVHVYGNLQDLDKRPYGVSPVDLAEVAECIKVIPEAREANDESFEKAKEMIGWANKICFIGFGFDLTNVRRLGITGSPLHKLFGQNVDGKRYGVSQFGFTQYGMTKGDIEKARSLLNGGLTITPGIIGRDVNTKNIEKLKTLGYLRRIDFFLE